MKNEGIFSDEKTVSDLRTNILNWYDGYSWDGKARLLNPYSILSCLDMSNFEDYWVKTSPSVSFLHSLIAEYNGDPTTILHDEYDSYSQTVLGSAEAVGLTPAAGLFQTGYLTADKIAKKIKHP
jgi:hypothetical protein